MADSNSAGPRDEIRKKLRESADSVAAGIQSIVDKAGAPDTGRPASVSISFEEGYRASGVCLLDDQGELIPLSPLLGLTLLSMIRYEANLRDKTQELISSIVELAGDDLPGEDSEIIVDVVIDLATGMISQISGNVSFQVNLRVQLGLVQ